MNDKQPYAQCPVYLSEHFLLRLVEEGDAEDLLACYADATAVRLMNADNCTSDFHYSTIEEMTACIQDWLLSYARGLYVRFAIVDNHTSRAIGTIELFDKTKKLAILRLDLCSVYERQDYLLALLSLSIEHFYTAFGVQQLATKAIPAAAERIAALHQCGFAPAARNVNGSHGDYYVR